MLSVSFLLYERGISKINSFTNDILDKKGLKLGISVKTTKKDDFFKGHNRRPLLSLVNHKTE